MELVETLIRGIMVGSVYSLVALGFVLIFKASGVVNLAQGELLLFGSYILWSALFQLGLPLPVAFVLTLVMAALLGLALEHVLLRPLIGQPLIALIMMTIALAYTLRGVVLLIWGTGWHSYQGRVIPLATWHLGPIGLPPEYLWGFLLAMALMAAFILFFRYTRLGLSLRATAEDQQVAQSMGIRVKAVFGISWALAALVASLGGSLLGSISGVNPNLSLIGLKVLPVVIVGGMESVAGAIIAGPVVGMVEKLAGAYIRSDMEEVTAFVILVLVLLLRPYGLLGLKEIKRV